MEDGLGYVILQQLAATVGTLLKFGLERKLDPEERKIRKEAWREYEHQLGLYKEGIVLRPNRREIYRRVKASYEKRSET